MFGRRPLPQDLAALVDNMFAAVLSEEERQGLLVWIERWEDEHPDATAAERVTGWIDVAYDFQASRRPPVLPIVDIESPT